MSVLIPTLNSERTLPECLTAIRAQEYPPERVEIVVADGGSTDRTRAIAESFGARVVENPLVTGEAGKAAAFAAASGELVALVDSDNVLMSPQWLAKMTAPFADERVAGSEPLRFEALPSDTLIDRYCAVAGVNDPLCLFVGNYDRYSALTGKWTGLALPLEQRDGYVVFPLGNRALPTIGANGTMYRRAVLAGLVNRYLMDIDVPYLIAAAHPDALFAKVDVGIRHLYCSGVGAFVRKQTRRVRDFLHARTDAEQQRVYPWRTLAAGGVPRFILATVTMYPVLFQAFRGWRRSGDAAAFFHPAACWLTLIVYGTNTLFARGRPLDRARWRQ